jgi:hypothetical protein
MFLWNIANETTLCHKPNKHNLNIVVLSKIFFLSVSCNYIENLRGRGGEAHLHDRACVHVCIHSDSQGPSKQADHNLIECSFHPEVLFSFSHLYQFTFIVMHEISVVYNRDKLNQMNEFQSYMIDFMFQYVFLNMLSLTTSTFCFQIWIIGSDIIKM